MQVAFESLSRGKALKNMFSKFIRRHGAHRPGFQALLQPAFLGGVGDVHVFDTERAAIDGLAQLSNFSQRHSGQAKRKRSRVVLLVEVILGEVMKIKIEILGDFGSHNLKGIGLGNAVTARTVGIDET